MSATQKREKCFHCEAEPSPRSPYCRPCSKRVFEARQRASITLRQAIFRGELPHPKSMICVDCGKPAFDYDHRDYTKPLEADPVCRSCNQMRGPALRYAA